MDQRIVKLNEVAEQGNIKDLYEIIGKDVRILEDIDQLPFVETPLHTAASAGGPEHIQFAMEMMRLKPSFARKPNLNGYSPIHLALHKGKTQMVHQLLQHDANLVRVKGMEGITPLHYAAKNGNLALLEIFLSVCPDSIIDVTIRNETVLHIALKDNKLDAFKFLVGWLLREWPYWKKILEQKDEKGNTVLHTAVSNNQTQAARHLLAWGATRFNVNEKNLAGQTALDILNIEPRRQGVDNGEMGDIRKILESNRAINTTDSHKHYLNLPGWCESKKIIFIGNQVRKRISEEKRNALLVVAALLVTVTYQAILSPPGGLWQEDLFESNTTDVLQRSPDELFKLNITAPHRAGSATARGTFAFAIFMAFNSIIFLSSITTMAVLVPPEEVVGVNLIAGVSVSLCFSYFSSLMIITQAPDWLARIVLISPLIIIIVRAALIIARKDGQGNSRNDSQSVP